MSLVDPFGLPDWLGTDEVTWHAEQADRTGHRVDGALRSVSGEHPCDLLAVDQAFPAPVADDETRRLAHQAWRAGEVLLWRVDGRLTLAVPGSGFTAERVLDALGRMAKAVGARPESYVVALRLGVIRNGER